MIKSILVNNKLVISAYGDDSDWIRSLKDSKLKVSHSKEGIDGKIGRKVFIIHIEEDLESVPEKDSVVSEEEYAALKKEVASLKRQISKLKKTEETIQVSETNDE